MKEREVSLSQLICQQTFVIEIQLGCVGCVQYLDWFSSEVGALKLIVIEV